MTRGWIRASLGIMASALAGLACALADDAGQAVCSGSFSGKGCGTCVGCEPPGLCAADGSCVICDFSKASGADNGGNGRECVTVKATPRATAVTPYTYSSERAAFGVVRLNCKGLLLCVPNRNPNVFDPLFFSNCEIVDSNGYCLCTVDKLSGGSCSCPSTPELCAQHTNCTSCALAGGCGWCSLSRTSETNGTCMPTSDTASCPCIAPNLCPNDIGKNFYTSPMVCPIPPPIDCSAQLGCTACAASHCTWCATSYIVFAEGTCLDPSMECPPDEPFRFPPTPDPSKQCPSPNDNVPNPFASQYQRQRDIVTWTVAGNCILLFGIALVTLFMPRPSVSPSEVSAVRAFRISALRIAAGVLGLLGSFATVSSILSLAGGAVAFVVMRDAQTVGDIARAVVIGLIEVTSFVVVDATVIPRVLQVDATCETYSDSNCAYYFSEGYARDMTIISVYVVNGITFAFLNLALNSAFLVHYRRTIERLMLDTTICGSCGRGATISGDSSDALMYELSDDLAQRKGGLQ